MAKSDVLTARQAAIKLGMRYKTLLYHIRQGYIASTQFGNSYALSLEEVERYAANRTAKKAAR